MKGRVLVISLVMTIVVSAFAVPAAAQTTATCPTGKTATAAQGLKITPDQRAACGFGQHPSVARIAEAQNEAAHDPQVAAKMQKFEAWEVSRQQESGVHPLTLAGWMNVPLIMELDPNWCGPASELMALRYMGAAGGLPSGDYAAEQALWNNIGAGANGSDSELMAADLNSRQSRNYYLGTYGNMYGVGLSTFESHWEFDLGVSAPGIPDVETYPLPSYGGVNYWHYMTEKSFDWTSGTVGYNDPNDITHYGYYTDPASSMLAAIQARGSVATLVW